MKRLNQKGAVSLISIVIFTIILAIITSAYMFSVIAQQRQAQAYDFGTRAYYVAESGVQDAIRALKANDGDILNTGQNDCKPLRDGTGATITGNIGGSPDYRMQYTCQLINTEPASITGTVGESENVTIQLTPAETVPAGNQRLVLLWSEKIPDSTPSADQTCARESYFASNQDIKFLTPHDEWRGLTDWCRVHPMMRLSVINHPKTNFTSANVGQQVRFLNPFFQAASLNNPNTTITAGQTNNSTSRMEELITNANCYWGTESFPAFVDGGASYSCRAIITLSGYSFSSDDLYARLHSIYGNNVQFQLSLQQDDGTPIPLANTQAVIDVTGKSGGNVFKRVRQTVNIGGAITTDNIPDAALVSGNGICKDFLVGTSQSHFVPGSDDCWPID